jgi:hypothetical protein
MTRQPPPGFLTASVLLLIVLLLAFSGFSTSTATAAPAAAPLGSDDRAPASVVSEMGPVGGTSASVPSAAPRALETGRGTFFTSEPVPNGTSSYSSCVGVASYFGSAGRDCFNATVDPTLNLTSLGTTALAYTTFTDDAPCGGMRANATTEIGFTTSTTFGARWTAPTYLGNPVCSTPGGEDQNYSNAMEPSLTSLSNGTLVLSYVEYNITNVSGYYQPIVVPYSIGCAYTVHNRVVVTESYDNGSSWTTPYVLAEAEENHTVSTSCSIPGIPLLRPSATAVGDTIYVAWMDDRYPYEECCVNRVNYSSTLSLAVSTDGGAVWTNASVPPTIILGSRLPFSDLAEYPDLAVSPSGRLFLSYATGFSEHAQCDSSYCGSIYNASLVVGRSTDNGSSFNFTVVTSDAGSVYPYDYFSLYLTDPLSQMAYDPLHDDLDLVYSSGQAGKYCYYEASEPPYCDDQDLLDDVFFTSSANGGVSFSTPVRVAPSLSGSKNSPYNELTLPSIAVDANGTLEVAFSLENDSQCTAYTCDAAQEVYVNSTDHGVRWSAPAIVDENFSYLDPYPCPACQIQWMGTSSATLSAGDQVLIAWPQLYNPNGSYSSWGSGSASVSVETSRLFTGSGITVTFNETGLPAGAAWALTVGGFHRGGLSGANLSISGVPPSYNLSYSGGWTNVSAGIAYAPSFLPASPGSFSSNAAVAVLYSEQVEVTLATIPFISTDSYYWSYYTNYVPAPLPGSYWAPVGTPFTAGLVPNTPVFCYPCLNLSFLSWTGSGAGSINTTSPSVSFTPLGPVTESASFSYTGYCYPSPSTCFAYNFSQSFSEIGLPAGTPWGVTLLNANGSVTQSSATGSSISLSVGSGLVQFEAWDVPDGSTGQYWIPTTSLASPASFPTLPVQVQYHLGSTDGSSASVLVRETGLPNGTSWSVGIGAQQRGTSSATTTVPNVPMGRSVALNSSSVYFENGTGDYLARVTVEPLTVNGSSSVLSAGGSIALNGSAIVTFEFQPSYLVTPLASDGGNVTPSPGWVDLGASINLTAVPSSGYHFVGWAGTGIGSVSSGTAMTISVDPRSPVSELATFRANFPATWNVTIQATGFGSQTPFTVLLGGIAYSGAGELRIGNLSSGAYDLQTPMIGLNGSNSTRLVEASINAPGLSGNRLDLSANITLAITYQVEYALSVFATPGGSVTDYSNGVYWLAPGPVALTAVPSDGQEFVAWTGTVSSVLTTLVLPLNGASNETAQFEVRPTAPAAVFDLTVAETGLPAGTPWTVSVGSSGASGATASLTIAGLNGTYLFTAPTVFGSTGVRYVSDEVNVSQSVGSNRSIAVAFTTEYLVSVAGGAGGSVTPGTAWVSAGGSLTLVGAPDASEVFGSWNGTVNSTSAALNVSVDGPITEFATFLPAPHPASPGTSSSSGVPGLAIGVALLAVLLIVGVVGVGLLSRRRAPAPPEEWEPGAPEGEDVYPEGPLEYSASGDAIPEPDGLPPEGPA